MAVTASASPADLIASLEDYADVVAWINDIVAVPSGGDPEESLDLIELDQHITHLATTLEIASEDTSSRLERIIDDVSRGVPRLAYDLHFMNDSATSLQAALAKERARSRESIPQSTAVALDHLRLLDTIKGRMEAARDVLREAESWSTLEMEVTSLLAEQNYTKAAERLSEASRSMVVFQNTPEYEPRRTMMVSLQNQLEASLSSALVAAINSQDVVVCQNYFAIFSNIQRESEFRNYYNGSRRASVVALWQSASLLDCDSSSSDLTPEKFTAFLPKFYAAFISLLNQERTSIAAIFPDPPLTLSTLMTSTLSALQPSFSQRLSSLFNHYGASGLKEVITAFKMTEEFATGADKIMEKIKYSALTVLSTEGVNPTDTLQSKSPRVHVRRRSTRMSMSWRPNPNRSSSSGIVKSFSGLVNGIDWDQELFQPFVSLQVDYGSLERRLLESTLQEIMSDSKERIPSSDRARLLRESSVDVIGIAEESVSRCVSFTYGYGALGLLQALDHFLQSFVDLWTAEIQYNAASVAPLSTSEEDLSDLDYSAQDWADFQLSLHLLASARTVFERLSVFETKLRSNLAQISTSIRLAMNDPIGAPISGSTRGGIFLLEQSALNSLELQNLFNGLEDARDPFKSSSSSTVTLRHSQSYQSGSPPFLLADARAAIYAFAKACQVSLQGTILAPLRKYLQSYSQSPSWTAPGDPKVKRVTGPNDLQVPSFSLSPSDIIQRVAEGLLNLPRLFEVYADDDALSFSLQTLPHIDPEMLKGLTEQPIPGAEVPVQPQTHLRRPSISASRPSPIDPEAVSVAWLSSLGQSLLSHLTETILPDIQRLTATGAAQLSSDLGYLSNIVRALNVEFQELEKWREYVDMDDADGAKKAAESSSDQILRHVARMRGWTA